MSPVELVKPTRFGITASQSWAFVIAASESPPSSLNSAAAAAADDQPRASQFVDSFCARANEI